MKLHVRKLGRIHLDGFKKFKVYFNTCDTKNLTVLLMVFSVVSGILIAEQTEGTISFRNQGNASLHHSNKFIAVHVRDEKIILPLLIGYSKRT